MNFSQPLVRVGDTPGRSSIKRRRASAYTIVEVMMAACVMALALTSGLAVMGRSFAAQDSARCISYASQILQSEMEKIRITSWSDVSGYVAEGSEHELSISSLGYSNATDLSTRMRLFRTVENIRSSPGVMGVVRITLKITWKTFDGRAMERTYYTHYSQAGLYDYFAA